MDNCERCKLHCSKFSLGKQKVRSFGFIVCVCVCVFLYIYTINKRILLFCLQFLVYQNILIQTMK